MSLSVLPMHERPTCEWCARRLRPHYRTETADGPTKWRKLRPEEMRSGADPHDTTAQPKDEVYFYDGANDTYHGPEYRRGCWRVLYHSTRVVSREFLGRYGFAGLFCNAGHAAAWAIVNCERLRERQVLRWSERLVSRDYNWNQVSRPD